MILSFSFFPRFSLSLVWPFLFHWRWLRECVSNRCEGKTLLEWGRHFALSERSFNLIEIDLSGNSYSEQVLHLIVDRLLEEKRNWTSIDTRHIHWTIESDNSTAIAEFVRLFEGNSVLRELDLSDNAFGPLGARALKPILLNNPRLRSFASTTTDWDQMEDVVIAEGLTESHPAACGEAEPSSEKDCNGRNRLESSSIELAKAFSHWLRL